MATKTPAESFLRVNPASLVMRDQVRTETNEKEDKELMQSIAAVGVLQPILVRREGKELVVIAGHRRTAQAIAAKVKDVPIVVTTVDPDSIPALQLVENLQRSDMTLNDIADGVWKLYEGPANGVAKVVAEMVGKGKSWVSKMLLLNAPSKANSVAKSLMARDKLHDIEMAYTLCQIEELSKDTAKAIGDKIEEHTRATLQAELKKAKKAAGKADTEGDGNGDGNPEDPPEGYGGDLVPVFDPDMLTFLQRIVTEATVKAADMDMKARTLAVIRAALDDSAPV